DATRDLHSFPTRRSSDLDVRALPFADGSFDVVVSTSTLDHFQARADIDTALRELHRVLASDGLAVVTLDNPWNPLVALRNALPRSEEHTSELQSRRDLVC